MGISYGSDMEFRTREDAYEVRDHLIEIANRTGYVTEEDLFNAASISYDTWEDEVCSIGWSLADILQTSVTYCQSTPILRTWYIDLPAPKDISNLMAKNINNTRRTNKMVNYNSMPTTKKYSFEDALPEEVEFEKKRKELMDEAEKKILDIRHELAIALDKIEEERFERQMKYKEQSQAKAWKRKYDALVEAGFTEDQAWEMTMKSFELD